MFYMIDSKINEADKRLMMSDINELFDKGIWCYNVPYFQTWPNLLELKGNHWKNLKNSFLESAKEVTEKNFINIKCWSYKSFAQVPPTEEKKQWHSHDMDTTNKICAILYLSLPEGSNGTEYKNGNGEIKIMPFKENFWTFYPCQVVHRPGFWDHKKMFKSRTIIAIDAYY